MRGLLVFVQRENDKALYCIGEVPNLWQVDGLAENYKERVTAPIVAHYAARPKGTIRDGYTVNIDGKTYMHEECGKWRTREAD